MRTAEENAINWKGKVGDNASHLGNVRATGRATPGQGGGRGRAAFKVILWAPLEIPSEHREKTGLGGSNEQIVYSVGLYTSDHPMVTSVPLVSLVTGDG